MLVRRRRKASLADGRNIGNTMRWFLCQVRPGGVLFNNSEIRSRIVIPEITMSGAFGHLAAWISVDNNAGTDRSSSLADDRSTQDASWIDELEVVHGQTGIPCGHRRGSGFERVIGKRYQGSDVSWQHGGWVIWSSV